MNRLPLSFSRLSGHQWPALGALKQGMDIHPVVQQLFSAPWANILLGLKPMIQACTVTNFTLTAAQVFPMVTKAHRVPVSSVWMKSMMPV